MAAVVLGLAGGIGCGDDTGGMGDAGSQLTSGVYVASAARNLLDQCNQDPNNAQSPLQGSTFLIDVDGGTVLFYGSEAGGLVGTPPQPAQGQGTVTRRGSSVSRAMIRTGNHSKRVRNHKANEADGTAECRHCAGQD